MSRTIKIIFTLSILFNLALIGVGIGTAYKFHDFTNRHHTEIKKDLSPEGHEIVTEHFKKSRGKNRDRFRDMRSAHKELKEIINAEEFDPDAFEKSAIRFLDMKSEMSKTRMQKSKEILQKLSPKDRRIFANRLLMKLKSGPKEKSHKKNIREN